MMGSEVTYETHVIPEQGAFSLLILTIEKLNTITLVLSQERVDCSRYGNACTLVQYQRSHNIIYPPTERRAQIEKLSIF
jgi:hypothetical protein